MGEKQLLRELDEYFCEHTGKKLGDLYLFAPKKKMAMFLPPLEAVKKSAILFDSTRGNVHMIPKDISLAEKYSTCIVGKREEILKSIEVIKLEDDKKQYAGIGKPIKSRSAAMFSKSPYSEVKKYGGAKDLFAFFGVISEETGTQYDLVFNRFFVDDNNRVNCILLCPQIKMYERGNEPKSIEYYPDTSKPDKGNTVYYNLDVDIHDSSEKIAKAFLEFVRKKENERA